MTVSVNVNQVMRDVLGRMDPGEFALAYRFPGDETLTDLTAGRVLELMDAGVISWAQVEP